MKYLLILCLLFAQFVTAQPVPEIEPALLETMEWRSVGPSRGGRATAIEGIAEKPYTFFMGTTGGGVWITNDAGQEWKNISDQQITVGSIGAIEAADADANIIYVGTGSADPRGNISAGNGIYRSLDGGENWKHIGLKDAGQISKIITHPDDPMTVWVSVLGNIFGPGTTRGVYKSTNGGDSWRNVLYVNDSTGSSDIVMDPENPRILYAAMWQAERKPWTLIDGGTNGGIWKSKDGGETWEKLGGGLPTGLLGKIEMAVSPANPNRVWAIIQTKVEEDGGVYHSSDKGKTWKRINGDHKLRQRGWYYSHITAHPTEENTLYASNTGFYKSVDGGVSWDQRISTPHGDNHGVWINPQNPDIMINCNDGGANITLNGGASWSTQHNQPTSEFYRLTLDNGFPYRLYAGQQDNSTISVPAYDLPAVSDTEHWMAIGGGECADVAVDPRNRNIVYATSYSGEMTYTNLETGEQRQITAYPHYTEGTAMSDLKYRWQWNYPIFLSKYNPDHIYQASNYVMRSADKGQTWEIISPDLTRNIKEYQGIPGGPIQHDATGVEVYSSIFALEESPQEEGVIWAGSDDGLIHITRNGGESWENITPKSIPYEATINKIELSTHAPGRAFVAAYHYRYNDFKPYLLRTDDYGKSWKLLTDGSNGIPSNHFVRAVAEDPDVKGLIYAGTEFGMYVSFNDGKSWQSLQLNLPYTPITDMEVYNKDLAISTQGRAFWILDDLTPLHQIKAAAAAENYLFKPRNTVRTNVGGWKGLSANIHFKVSENAKNGTVKLAIVDSQNDTAKTWSLNDDLKAGMNKVSWDLRYDAPKMADNFVAMVFSTKSAPGPKAVPGIYKVHLTVNGEIQTQELEIVKDPRWENITVADYQEQYDFAQEIKSLINESQNHIRAMRSAKAQIENTASKAMQAGYSESIKAEGEAIISSLNALEEDLFQNKILTSQDEINFPRKWTNHIARLYRVVVDDDDKPTGGMRERYQDLKQQYENYIAPLDEVMNSKIPGFNKMLQSEGVPNIIWGEE